MGFGPFIVYFFCSGLLSFILTVAGMSLPIYETNYSGARGWETSLWRTCLKSEAAPCKTIDESILRCDRLGHTLRTARAFCVLSVLALSFQCGLAVAFISKFYRPLSRFPYILTAAVTFVLLLIGWVATISLYTEKQCAQSRQSAEDISYVKLSESVPLMIVSSIIELCLFFATLLWPKKWSEASGDEMIFTGQDPEVVAAEKKANEIKYTTTSKADEKKDDEKDEKKKDDQDDAKKKDDDEKTEEKDEKKKTKKEETDDDDEDEEMEEKKEETKKDK